VDPRSKPAMWAVGGEAGEDDVQSIA
jgi:hypothetical protein